MAFEELVRKRKAREKAIAPSSISAEGRGLAYAHNGEILQGVFEGEDGDFRRGLITLPCSSFRSEATFMPHFSAKLTIEPTYKLKAREAAELALERHASSSMGGHLSLNSNVPLGLGLGSSTSDVVSAILAVDRVMGKGLTPYEVGALAVESETASDAIMFGDRAILFARRDGRVIEDFGGPLPGLEVLGFVADPLRGSIDTVTLSPVRYTEQEKEAFRWLVELMREAIVSGDPALVGRVASTSARINQRYLPKPHFDRLEQLVEDAGALGLQVAHSGTVAGLLFDPADTATPEKIDYARKRLAELGFSSTWRFATGVAKDPATAGRMLG